MSLAGKTDGFELEDLLTFGKFGDLKTGEIRAMIEEIKAAIGLWEKFTALAAVPVEVAERVKAQFRTEVI